MLVVDQVLSVTGAKGRVDDTGTAAGSCSIDGSNIDVRSNEADVQDDGNERGKRMTGKATQKQETENCVENSDTRNTLNGASPCWYRQIAVGKYRKEVREERKNQSATTELDAADEPLDQFESETRFRAHIDDCVLFRTIGLELYG